MKHTTSSGADSNTLNIDKCAPLELAPSTTLIEYPLTDYQQLFWAGHERWTQQPVYNVTTAFVFEGTLNAERFKLAFFKLVTQQEAFRTTITVKNGQPIQQLKPHGCNLEQLDLSSEDNPDIKAQRIMREYSAEPFELSEALTRSALLKCGDEKWIWILTQHHIITDLWSISRLYQQLAEHYDETGQVDSTDRNHCICPYSQYVAIENDYRASKQSQDSEANWQSRLSTRPEPIRFYGDIIEKRPNSLKRHPVSLGDARTIGLDELAGKLELQLMLPALTKLSFYLTVLFTYVYRISGNRKISIGVPFHNRIVPKLAETVGLIMEVCPISIEIEFGDTYSVILKKVQTELLDTLRHYRAGSAPASRWNHYEILLNYLEISYADFSGLPTQVERVSPTVSFDLLSIHIHQFGATKGWTVEFDFQEEAFREYSSDAIEHFFILMDEFIANRDQKVDEIKLLSPTEQDRVLESWNATKADIPPLGIHQLFEQQVERTPNAIAVNGLDGRLTYSELEVRSNRFAHSLIEQGVVSDTTVGICVDRSASMLIGLLGILKTGAAYVPLDPHFPVERLRHMVDDGAVALVVTDGASRKVADQLPIETIDLIQASNPDARDSTALKRPLSSAKPSDLAYVIYTSGSTGKPKGVQVTHANVVNLLTSMGEELHITSADVLTALTTISFDISVLELFLPLTVGAQVEVASFEVAGDGRLLGELVQRSGTTIMQATPTTWRLLMDSGWRANASLKALCGGEAMPMDLGVELAAQVGALWNVYGPTETTIWSTCHRVTEATDDIIPIGRPLANTQVYVLDRHLQPVPVGVPGTLYIAGAGVTQGYRNQPSLSDERFVPNPFSALGLLYNTGDVVRWRAGGELAFFGRADTQLKIRGFRIELGEIESTVQRHPDVAMAVVDAREFAPDDLRLVGYIVPKSPDTLSPSALKEYLRAYLPDYMVPSYWVELRELPLTANNKLDRKALPAPSADERKIDQFAEPQTPTEKTIAAIWADTLGCDRVGRYDNFFDLGGHSLLANTIAIRCSEALQVDLSLRSFFETPTLNEQAAVVDTLAAGGLLQARIPPAPADAPPISSLSQDQLRYIWNLAPDSAAYNLRASRWMRGTLQVDALAQALTALSQRHALLCSRYPESAATVIVIDDALPAPLEIVDVVGASTHERRAEALAQATAWVALPFDLHNGPLWRACLLRVDDANALLVFSLHHIIGDARSLDILWHDLGELYRAELDAEAASLPPLDLAYSDYAHWHRARQLEERCTKEIAFWTEYLHSAPAALNLPTDRRRPQRQTFAGSSVHFALSETVVTRVRDYAQKANTSPYIVMLSAFYAWLSRVTGQSDLVIGTPVSGRNYAGMEHLIGLFVNSLALRVQVDDTQNFAQLLNDVQQSTLSAFEHQEVPFVTVVEHLQLPQDRSRNPVFQVFFGHRVRETNAPWPDLHMEPQHLAAAGAHFDFEMLCEQTQTGIVGHVNYNTDLFEPESIARLCTQYERILFAALTDPNQALFTLPLQTPAERAQLLDHWNATKADIPPLGIHQLFEQQVERTPNAIAISLGAQSWTYQELNERANQLAHYLQQHGVGPDIMVGVCMERCLEMSLALMAVLKAGGAYVPFDPSFPAERLGFMLEDTQVPVMLSMSQLINNLPVTQAKLLCLDSDQALWAPSSRANTDSGVQPEHLFNVIFTSGSTGKPKGVMVPHQGIVNRLLWMQDAYPLDDHDRVLQKTPYSFDVSVWELFWPLLVGARLDYAKPEGHKDANYLRDTIVELGITTLHFVPSMLGIFLQADSVQKCSSIRRVFCSGEALQIEHERRFFACFGHAQELHNLYGPTEASVDVAYFACQPNSHYTSVPIGKPVANTQLHILDTNLQPVPVGIVGELYLGGVQLARGYLNREALTRESFIDNPFYPQGHPSKRLYKTGDLARYLPDGNIDYIGRVDFQVKVRGLRIELGEIESTVQRHPDVAMAVVDAREFAPDDLRLVGYIVPKSPDTLSPSALKEYLRAYLPDYMVPSYWVELRELPLTANNKLDRKALPAPSADERKIDQFAEPQTPTEKTIAAIWADTLGCDRVGRYDNFFDLGGHSLLANTIAIRCSEALQVDLSLRSFFETPTLNEQAAVVDTLAAGGLLQARIPPAPADAPPISSLSQDQLRYIWNLAPDSAAYNLRASRWMRGTLQVDALAQALTALSQRHALLCSRYPESAATVIVIDDALPAPLEIVDVVGASTHERRAEALAQATAWVALPFDLHNGPLWRACLLRVDDANALLVFSLHHIIGDARSLDILWHDLGELYRAELDAEAASLPPLDLAYSDYAHWHRARQLEERCTKEIAFWTEYLHSAPAALNLPTDRRRPQRQTFAGSSVHFALSETVVTRVRDYAQKANTSPYIVMLSAFYAWLSRVTGQSDLVIGTPVSGRNYAGMEHLIGLFVNSLALRVQVDDTQNFAQLLNDVQQSTLSAFEHQEVPFVTVVEHLQLPQDRSRNPVFQVFFGHRVRETNAPWPDLHMEPQHLAAAGAHFDFEMLCEQTQTGIVGHVNYNTDLFEPESIARLCTQYERILFAALTDPNQALFTLPLQTPAERAQLLDHWNATKADIPPLGIHQLFEQQVERTPNAIAISLGAQSWTYQELNERANQLAHYLQQHGVGPDIMVGVCMERCLEMSLALMAVLKAGGAYVPFDPSFPAERLGFMLEDTQVPVMLSMSQLINNLPVTQAKLLCLDSDQALWAPSSRANTDSGVQPEHLFNVIFTSGSTGKPKGVMVPHQGIVNRLLWMQDAYPLDDHDRVLQKTPYSFDVSVWELFWPLLVGARLDYAKPEGHKDANYLRDTIVELGITTLHFVPSMLGIFLQADSVQKCSSIRRVFCSGEALQIEHERRFFACFGHAQELHNLYGPTEASVDVAYFACQPNSHYTSVPIGKPVANTQLHILDTNLQPVPVGIVGELYLGGVQLARGYLNREALTRESFIDNPFYPQGHPSKRLYKTGDLARYLPDGNIDYIGRVDFQVKVRGLRIELGEIESTVQRHPDVAMAVVDAREFAPDDLRLVGYIVPKSPDTLSPSALKEYLRAYLPDYMVPSYWVELRELPLTANNKLDRKALPAPSADERKIDQFAEPQTPTEKTIAAIWADTLGCDRVGRYDNFFDLGGHSLLANTIAIRCSEALQVDLSLRSFFETPTLNEQAAVVDTLAAGGLLQARIPPAPADAPPISSLSQDQLRYIWNLAPDSAAYNLRASRWMRGTLQVDALAQALTALSQRHALLCSRYPESAATVIVIDDALPAPLEIVDVVGASTHERRAEALAQATAWVALPFDLHNGPLWRACLLRVDDANALLVFSLHHIIGDARSLDILWHDLGELYRAELDAEAASLPPLDLAYSDYAHWHRARQLEERCTKEIAFWTEYLHSAPAALNLPTDRRRPQRQTFAGSSVHFALSETVVTRVRDYAQKANTSPYIVMLSAFYAWLSRVTGQSDLVIGTPVSGRNYAGMEHLIGLFVNSLALRVQVDDTQNFAQLLNDVQQSTLSAFEHQEVPFVTVVEHLQLPQDRSRNPVFQVFFGHRVRETNAPWPDLHMEPQHLAAAGAHFDFEMLCEQTQTGIVGHVNYNTDLFEPESIARLCTQYERILFAALTDPNQALFTLPLQTPAERAQLLDHWNATKADIPPLGIHQLFEQQVERTPNAIAVNGLDGRLTYSELEVRSNRFAHSLIEQGVVSDTTVGICVDRSASMLIGLLGILKTGAAYVPLDPHFPVERLRHMVDDGAVALVVTDGASRKVADQLPIETIDLIQASNPDARDSTALKRPLSSAKPSDLAYVIYTSGSTGKPKGVQVTHANVVNLLTSMGEELHITSADVLTALTTISFDISVLELFLPLTVGAQVEVASFEVAGDGRLLGELVQRSGTTIMQATPTTWRLLMDSGWRANASLKALCGGEAMPMDLGVELAAQVGALWNVYGPTETTIWSTCHRVTEATDDIIPIGRPLANTQVYVLDRHLQPVPVGVPGTLYIAGAGVTQGYRNQPSLSDERFVPNPFSALGLLYNTGDVVRWRAGGELAFFGRADTQLKIRGFRIELGEIESTVQRHPDVAMAVVDAREFAPDDLRLVGYIVPKSPDTLSPSALKEYLRAYLPDYMVPSYWVELRELPLTANNKLDRKALPAPSADERKIDQFAEPQTPTEKTIAAIWADTLGCDRVGRYDNFFDLGGHSLLVVKMASIVLSETGIELNGFEIVTLNLSQIAAKSHNAVKIQSRKTVRFGWVRRRLQWILNVRT